MITTVLTLTQAQYLALGLLNRDFPNQEIIKLVERRLTNPGIEIGFPRYRYFSDPCYIVTAILQSEDDGQPTEDEEVPFHPHVKVCLLDVPTMPDFKNGGLDRWLEYHNHVVEGDKIFDPTAIFTEAQKVFDDYLDIKNKEDQEIWQSINFLPIIIEKQLPSKPKKEWTKKVNDTFILDERVENMPPIRIYPTPYPF